MDDAIGAERPIRPGVLGGFRALAADGDARLVVAVLSARQLMIGVTDVLFVLLAIEVFGTGDRAPRSCRRRSAPAGSSAGPSRSA